MKLILTLFIFFSFYQNSFAQKNFEGEIIYKNVSKFDTTKNGIIKVLLKGKKMLMTNETRGNEDPIYCLYDFEKGKNFTFIPSDSVVLSTILMSNLFTEIIDTVKSKEIISGYQCYRSVYKIYPPMDNFITNLDASFSDRILFQVPINMRFISPPFIIFNDSSISLNVKIKASKMPDSDLKNIELEYKAITIQERKLDETLFEIPKNFKELSAIEYSNALMKKFNEINKNLGTTDEEVEASIKKMTDTIKQTLKTSPKTPKKKILKKKKS